MGDGFNSAALSYPRIARAFNDPPHARHNLPPARVKSASETDGRTTPPIALRGRRADAAGR
jgi:hypothetical protein